MPVHNWKPVDANLFHHFHQRWTAAICDELNDRLPTPYSALIEQHPGGLVPDVIALERRGGRIPADDARGGVLTMSPPETKYVIETKEDVLAARANRIVIRHRLGDVVCVIEIVSPGNKSSRPALKGFVDKSVAFLRNSVNLLVIDLFPPTPRDPEGIHKAIWDELEDAPFELSPDEPLTLAAYVAGDFAAGISTRAYVQPVAVGAELPDMPAYLDRQANVPVPLEATYQIAWHSCPRDMQFLLETGKLPGEDE
jgi:hypothetical protein